MCWGDCPKGQCLSWLTRTCGGNQEGKGCGTGHMGHQYFCKGDNKSTFSTQVETALMSDAKENVVLL